MVDVYDITGLTGVAVTLYAYARVQWRREYAKEMAYSVINLIGALMLNVAVWDKWNVASFTGNTIWACISLYGIYRCIRYARLTAKRRRV